MSRPLIALLAVGLLGANCDRKTPEGPPEPGPGPVLDAGVDPPPEPVPEPTAPPAPPAPPPDPPNQGCTGRCDCAVQLIEKLGCRSEAEAEAWFQRCIHFEARGIDFQADCIAAASSCAEIQRCSSLDVR